MNKLFVALLKDLKNKILHDVRTPIRQRNAGNHANIAAVAESVRDDSNLSIPRRSQHLGI